MFSVSSHKNCSAIVQPSSIHHDDTEKSIEEHTTQHAPDIMMNDGIDNALCSVAKVSSSLLQRLGFKCWDVIHISLHMSAATAAAAAAAAAEGPSRDDEQGDDHLNLSSLLTSFIVQVIPDDDNELMACSPSHHQVCIHPVLLDFVHAAAAAEASLLSSVTSRCAASITPTAPLPGRSNNSEEHPKDADNDSQEQSAAGAPSIDNNIELSSFRGLPCFEQQYDDDNDGNNNDGDFSAKQQQQQQQQQHYQWRIQKAASDDCIRQLENGSTLIVQCVYSDAPILLDEIQNNGFCHHQNNSTTTFGFSCNDVAVAFQDRLIQKGCIILLPIDVANNKLQQQQQQKQEGQCQKGGFVIARIQDICLPPNTTTAAADDDNNDDSSDTGDDDSDHQHPTCRLRRRDHRPVYRVGTCDCFQLSILASSSLSPSKSISLSSREASIRYPLLLQGRDNKLDDNCNIDGDEAVSCPGYESLQQQLVQLLDPRSRSSISSSSSTFVNLSSSSLSSFCRPTGVLLTGSVGVGKTRLAKCVARQLSLNCKTMVHWISLEDVLLMHTTTGMSSTTMLEDLKLTLLPPFTNVLMIDDLHILATATEDGGGETELSFPDMERRLLQSALHQVVDACVEQGIPCLGIASTEWKLLPTTMVKFGRLEKQLEMSSPTQYQREMILHKQLGDIMMMMMPVDEHNNSIKNNKAKQWASILAPLTAGCVAADLCRLCHNAQIRSWARQQKVNDDNDVADCNLVSEADVSFSLPPSPPLLWEDLRDAAQELVPFQLATLDVIKPEPPPQHLGLHDKSGSSILKDKSSSSSRKISDDWLAIHDHSWSRLAGYSVVKKRVYRTIVAPWRRFLKHEHQKHSSSNNGNDDVRDKDNETLLLIPPPTGVIFHGASGSGKTLAATCLGASLEWSTIHVNVATDILDQWLGGSEASLRSLFARARAAAPCILFLDEMDAIACNRNNSENGDSTNVMSRLLSTLLNEMDGIGGSSSLPSKVLVVACTNQPLDSIDAALLRPGRLDHHIELKTPVTKDDAVTILQQYLSRKNSMSIDQRQHDKAHEQTTTASLLHDEVDLQVIADRALHGPKWNEVTGATLEGLARQAILSALRRNMADVSRRSDSDEVIQVTMQDFEEALSKV